MTARKRPTDDTGLAAIGLRAGEQVRFRRREHGRWELGTVIAIERDGSIGVRDARGGARALPMARIEVRATGPRGARTWEPLADRASRTEQLAFW